MIASKRWSSFMERESKDDGDTPHRRTAMVDISIALSILLISIGGFLVLAGMMRSDLFIGICGLFILISAVFMLIMAKSLALLEQIALSAKRD